MDHIKIETHIAVVEFLLNGMSTPQLVELGMDIKLRNKRINDKLKNDTANLQDKHLVSGINTLFTLVNATIDQRTDYNPEVR